MGRIKELINKFLQPNETELSFNELAIASGLSPEEIKELNSTINGVNWPKFAREDEEKKNRKVSEKSISKVEINKQKNTTKRINRNSELER